MKYKYFQIIKEINSKLPKEVEDTGLIGGINENWSLVHIYKTHEKYYINPDYIKELSSKEIKDIQKLNKEA